MNAEINEHVPQHQIIISLGKQFCVHIYLFRDILYICRQICVYFLFLLVYVNGSIQYTLFCTVLLDLTVYFGGLPISIH